MNSTRKESFRFNFKPPIFGNFQIIQFDKQTDEKIYLSSLGPAVIMNISPTGLNIKSTLRLPVIDSLLLEFEFEINELSNLTLIGYPVWRKKVEDQFNYGIKLKTKPEERSKLIAELKKYSRRINNLEN